MSDPLLAAERDGLASMLLDVQRDCAELRAILRECQQTLAMMIDPGNVRYRQTSVMNAYAACVASEAKARRVLGGTP